MTPLSGDRSSAHGLARSLRSWSPSNLNPEVARRDRSVQIQCVRGQAKFGKCYDQSANTGGCLGGGAHRIWHGNLDAGQITAHNKATYDIVRNVPLGFLERCQKVAANAALSHAVDEHHTVIFWPA